VGLLHADGRITRHFLDTNDDKFADLPKTLRNLDNDSSVSLDDVIAELNSNHQSKTRFAQIVHKWLEDSNVAPEIAALMRKAVSKTEGELNA
jgi:hypothetical protein